MIHIFISIFFIPQVVSLLNEAANVLALTINYYHSNSELNKAKMPFISSNSSTKSENCSFRLEENCAVQASTKNNQIYSRR